MCSFCWREEEREREILSAPHIDAEGKSRLAGGAQLKDREEANTARHGRKITSITIGEKRGLTWFLWAQNKESYDEKGRGKRGGLRKKTRASHEKPCFIGNRRKLAGEGRKRWRRKKSTLFVELGGEASIQLATAYERPVARKEEEKGDGQEDPWKRGLRLFT